GWHAGRPGSGPFRPPPRARLGRGVPPRPRIALGRDRCLYVAARLPRHEQRGAPCFLSLRGGAARGPEPDVLHGLTPAGTAIQGSRKPIRRISISHGRSASVLQASVRTGCSGVVPDSRSVPLASQLRTTAS